MADKFLIAAAVEARSKAYAPYSRFLVGAAVKDEKGAVHAGCNVENAAYPNGNCAETSAIAAMVLDGAQQIREIAVIGRGDLLCTPCGGCRQKIREFAKGNVKIHMCGEDGKVKQTFTLDELLPASFGPENLA